MMRTGLMAVLTLGLIATTAVPASAQGRGGIGSGWGGIELLLNPTVQKELKMDGPSIEKARALVLEMRDKQKGLNSLLEGLEGEDRMKRIQELATSHAEQGNKAIEAFLGPEQLARFHQIDLQQRGATALADPSVARTLRMSPDQSAKITPLLNRSVLQLREAAAASRGDRRVAFDKIQAIRKETDAGAVALLDEAQKQAWKTMIGEPLDLNPAPRNGR